VGRIRKGGVHYTGRERRQDRPVAKLQANEAAAVQS